MKNKELLKKTFKTRFYQWVSRADANDKSLDSDIRKRKWGLILSASVFLFGLSFCWSPILEFVRKDFQRLKINPKKNNDQDALTPTFEMPVDSFELHLRKNLDIHEKQAE